ncbi:MAG: FAD-dependent oxidoreductase [Collinsella sp.]
METPAPLAPTGKRVAVVGAGPSGLTCAYFLGLMGHSVTVFERRSRLGGMMRYGIPAYRLPRERLDEDIRAVLGAGDIEVRTGCDIQTDKMRSLVDEFDAVYVAVGAQGGKTLPIEGADAAGVMSAVDVLEAIGDEQYPDFTGKNVVVIGGGNVAMDCARTAVRAERRLGHGGLSAPSGGHDRATLSEVEAGHDGGRGNALPAGAGPHRSERGGARRRRSSASPSASARCAADVRPRCRADKPEVRLAADLVIIAVGQAIECVPFEEFGMQHDRTFRAGRRASCGRRASTPSSWAATASGAPRPSSWPSPRARLAAANIDELLGFHHTAGLRRCGAAGASQRPQPPTGACRWPSARRASANAISSTWKSPVSAEEAAQECGRCLRCDVIRYRRADRKGAGSMVTHHRERPQAVEVPRAPWCWKRPRRLAWKSPRCAT